MKLILLKTIKNSMDKQQLQALSYPTIDRLCLKHHPELVFEKKLLPLLEELISEKLIGKSEKGGIIFTQKGLDYLQEYSEK